MSSKYQREKFNEVYSSLNPEQKKAVDTIEGPVMVIAGPGTGKTQILAARIGKILLDTDSKPENIICLTFTDAGVMAMRRRLLSMIGTDAYRINIYTFHAFCNDVIQDNLNIFEKVSLDPVSELESIELFRELIDGFPMNHKLKKLSGNMYSDAKHLQELFALMKKEFWSPDFVTTRIKEYVADLPNREDLFYKTTRKGSYKAGDIKPAFDKELKNMERLQAAVNEFDNFQQLMRSRNLYDFDDMINWVTKAFEENKDLLADYQERYQYILVDEFQDSSGSQNRIVELLISYWESPNVFVVGDDDQSIFRFQGANVENMLDFADTYSKDLMTVVLSSNYRSLQPILDVSKTLISNNTERLINKMPGLTKDLVAGNEKITHLQYKPEVHYYASQRQEMIGITESIKKLLADAVNPQEIAVIYRNNSFGTELSEFLRNQGIRYFSKRKVNILDKIIIKHILQILQYLAAEHTKPYKGDLTLFQILHFNFFNVPPIEIAKELVQISYSNYKDRPASFRHGLSNKVNAVPKDLFSEKMNPALESAFLVLENLIHAVPNNTIQILIEKIINQTGLLKYVLQQDEKHQMLHELNAFFDFVKQQTHRKPFMGLGELVELFEVMQKEAVAIPLIEIEGNEKGVNLLTVHGSKGLEFEYVFFAGCNTHCWEKNRGGIPGFSYPDTLLKFAKSKETSHEEQRRLFYVALTRAKLFLNMSYCECRNDGKLAQPSMFLAEVQQNKHIETKQVPISEELLADYSALQLSLNNKPVLEELEKDMVSRLLEKFVMNVSALNNYLKCPLSFYFQNLIRIPSPKNKDLEYGTAVHMALEHLFRKMQANQQVFPPVSECINDFVLWMSTHRESFTDNEYDVLLKRGETMLTAYYNTYIYSWNKIVSTERNFNAIINNIPLRGKVDKLEFDGKTVNVVDYKTGNAKYGLEKLNPPTPKNPIGGDYWRQAVFYKLLVESSNNGWIVNSTEYDFVEPDNDKKLTKKKIVISPVDTEFVINQLTDAWNSIQRHEFYTGCGDKECPWCNFAKDNKLYSQLIEEEQQEEDVFAIADED